MKSESVQLLENKVNEFSRSFDQQLSSLSETTKQGDVARSQSIGPKTKDQLRTLATHGPDLIDIKPIHSNVVADVPGALAQYLELKEQEKQRLAQKAAVPVPPMRKQTRRESMRRRKTTFAPPPTKKPASTSSRGARPRKGSLQLGSDPEAAEK